MESIQRSFMLLRPGDGPHAHPQSRATLKMQSVQSGLSIQLSVSGLPSGLYTLYLFMQDGAAIYAGDVAGGGLRQTLSGIRLQNVWGAAVIHSASLAFCLKSTGVDWTDVAARFKLMHAPRPARETPVVPEPQPVIFEPEKPVDDNPPYPPEEERAAEPLHNTPEPEPEPLHPPFMTGHEPDPFRPSYMPENEPEPFRPPSTPDDIEDDEDDAICDSCPHAARQERINPFPLVFPNSEWTKISYPGPTGWWHYITGRIYSGPNIVAKAVGVPGEYGMTPPVWLEGFGTYLRCVTQDAHGYWLMFQDAETGEVLDMGLSPRDA